MVMTTCPECGDPVSDQAPMCPHCGYEVKAHFDPVEAESSSLSLEDSEVLDKTDPTREYRYRDGAMKLGAFGNRFGILMTAISAIWSLTIVYSSSGVFKLVISILLLPITVICTPVIPVIRSGDWTLFILSYGSWWIASSINVVAMAIAFPGDEDPPEIRRAIQKQFLVRRLTSAALLFLVIPTIVALLLMGTEEQPTLEDISQDYGPSTTTPSNIVYKPFGQSVDTIEGFNWFIGTVGDTGVKVLFPPLSTEVLEIDGSDGGKIFLALATFDASYSFHVIESRFTPDSKPDDIYAIFTQDLETTLKRADGYDLVMESRSGDDETPAMFARFVSRTDDGEERITSTVYLAHGNDYIDMGISYSPLLLDSVVNELEYFRSLTIF